MGLHYTKTQVTLTGSSQTLVAANPQRRGLILYNTSIHSVAIDITGGTAALGIDIPLPDGNFIIFSNLDSDCPNGRITAVGTSGDKITVYEGI